MRDRISKKKYLDAAQFYYMADTTADTRSRGLETIIGRAPKINDNIKCLIRLDCKHFITTNYDSTLEDAWASVCGNAIDSLANGTDDFTGAHRLMNQDKPFVIHIHGKMANPNSIVLSRSHYDSLTKRPEYFEFLRHVLMTKSILFIGFSFYDPALQAFMEYTKAHLQLRCEQPSYALIPRDYHDLANFLKEANTEPICFDQKDDHSGLWEMIRWFKAELKKDAQIQARPPSADEEVAKLKHNLAAVYTHFRIRAKHHGVYDAILVGIVHFIGQSITKQGQLVTLTNTSEALAEFLHIGLEAATSIVENSLSSLVRNDQAWMENNHYMFAEIDDSIDTDLDILVRSIRERAKMRYSATFHFTDQKIREFILQSLVTDGVRLAHSILAKYPLPLSSIGKIFNEIYDTLFGSSPQTKDSFLRTAYSLFEKPNKKEAKILGSVSRIAFLSDLALHQPDLKSLNMRNPIRHVYLDASILMPAICSYHPRSTFYQRIIQKARKNGIQCSVSDGFLEEIVKHRELAVQAFDDEFRGKEDRFKEYIWFHGSECVNVYLGAFSVWLGTEKQYIFNEFLKKYAPYATIPELISFLERKGIRSERLSKELTLEGGRIARWKAALKEWYAKRIRIKAPELVMHEAYQLEALSVSNSVGRTTMFLTADKRFIQSAMDVSGTQYLDPRVPQYITMPVQFSYYVDLDEERIVDWKAYSKILWAKGFREYHEANLEYFTDRILREYEPRLVESIPTVVAKLHEEVEKAPFAHELESVDEDQRMKQFRLVEQFDEKFYEIMNKLKEKLDLN